MTSCSSSANPAQFGSNKQLNTGFVEITSSHNGEVVRHRAPLTPRQAAKVVDQAMTMQEAMIRHNFSHAENLLPLEQDVFQRSHHGKHKIIER